MKLTVKPQSINLRYRNRLISIIKWDKGNLSPNSNVLELESEIKRLQSVQD